ncbi:MULTISPECIES: hypothetical protein [unclassified Granulicatella]|nr:MULTISPECIES: hypothetical protein [unclassified Granulicatella]
MYYQKIDSFHHVITLTLYHDVVSIAINSFVYVKILNGNDRELTR